MYRLVPNQKVPSLLGATFIMSLAFFREYPKYDWVIVLNIIGWC